MQIKCVWEHNGNDTLLYAMDFPGAFTRGEALEKAISKMPMEIVRYQRWSGMKENSDIQCEIAQEQPSELAIRDADSDVLFLSEREPLTENEYQFLKKLALKSAEDFLQLYDSISDPAFSILPPRKTFYGSVPRTAEEMYLHTKSVNDYYFGEIGIPSDHEGTILACRLRGFAALEKMQDFLRLPVIEGSYGEQWSLRKVIRRFIWHDRIHAKAMYRMACQSFPDQPISDPFFFSL